MLSVVLIAFCNEFFCRYQDFVEQHVDLDPQISKLSMAASKTAVGSASLDGAEDRQKTAVLARRQSVRRMEVTSVVHASTQYDTVPKGRLQSSDLWMPCFLASYVNLCALHSFIYRG